MRVAQTPGVHQEERHKPGDNLSACLSIALRENQEGTTISYLYSIHVQMCVLHLDCLVENETNRARKGKFFIGKKLEEVERLCGFHQRDSSHES